MKRIRNKSQYRDLTPNQTNLPSFLPGVEPAPHQLRVRRSSTELYPAPKQTRNCARKHTHMRYSRLHKHTDKSHRFHYSSHKNICTWTFLVYNSVLLQWSKRLSQLINRCVLSILKSYCNIRGLGRCSPPGLVARNAPMHMNLI